MKKIIKSKMFIAGMLAALCVCILTICVLGKNDKESEFNPESSIPIVVIDSWTENTISITEIIEDNDNNTYHELTETQTETQSNEITKVIIKTKNEIVIDFIEPPLPKDSPPETPGTKFNELESAELPSHVGKPHDNPIPDPLVPGNKNEKGEIYDSAFGWVTPGKVEQKDIDNQGDPNKMVGNW